MARVTRSSVLLKVQDLLGIQSGAQAPPVECPSTIQPVLESGPRHSLIHRAGQNTSTGTATLYTTPSDKDFYLTFAYLSITKNATCDCTAAWIQVTVDGSTKRLNSIPMQTTTAESIQVYFPLPYPLKLDRGSTITSAGSFTAGAMSKDASIGGFILE